MGDFTPWSALLGGAVLGVGASLLLIANGRVAGVSDIAFGALAGERSEMSWRVSFMLGLFAVGCAAAVLVPDEIGLSPRPLALLAVAGLMVGFGTRLGHGCTSGHGVCGISRRSPRSLVATLTFMLVAITTLAISHWMGAPVMKRKAGYQLVALISGVLFGTGLVISGMTEPRKVLNFLDVSGHWDPSLMLVMVGAIGVHALAYRAIRGRSMPWLSDHFAIPTRRDIDRRLLGGAAIFGVGWGLSGYCPGPAIVSLPAGGASALVFVAAMGVGMLVAAKLDALFSRSARSNT